MADKKPQRTQKSRPKLGKPIEIPVPKRKDFDKVLKRATKDARRPSRSSKSGQNA